MGCGSPPLNVLLFLSLGLKKNSIVGCTLLSAGIPKDHLDEWCVFPLRAEAKHAPSIAMSLPNTKLFEEICKPYGSLRKLDILSNGMVLVDPPFVIVIVPRVSGHVDKMGPLLWNS